MNKNKKIIYKNFIQKEFFNSKNNKKINKKFFDILNSITFNLDSSKSVISSLSNKFKFNFRIKDLNRFKKFNTVVIIGMGGSILGSEAIYFFLKKRIKKDFIFLNNIDEDELQRIKSKQKLSKILFIIISKSGSTIETLSNIKALILDNDSIVLPDLDIIIKRSLLSFFFLFILCNSSSSILFKNIKSFFILLLKKK